MKKSMIVGASVLRVFSTYLTVDLGQYKGIAHVSQITDFFIADLRKMFKEGEHYLWQILSVDEKSKFIRLSWKALMPRYQKDPFVFALQPTSKGFTALREVIKKEPHA